MGTMHLVAAAMFLVIMSCTLMPTTHAACDILPGECNAQTCNVQMCEHYFGRQRFTRFYCKKTPHHQEMCCCDFHTLPTGHHPNSTSQHSSLHTTI
ncbi:hypothetical protein HU200_016687 [Digitaria exilis]|uniref:Uncharacterized protein n=1 Tax=Digitaria exilis TaxID=1010633 RepID=A0A835KI31_9POAL|nr:hypothetical protein HU200_016687 [Digitaria exilis]